MEKILGVFHSSHRYTEREKNYNETQPDFEPFSGVQEVSIAQV